MTLTTRLAIAMIALVAIAVAAVAWLSQSNLERALLPSVLDRIETDTRFAATDLETYVGDARADIVSFRNLAAVAGLARARLNDGTDPSGHASEAAWRERLGRRLVTELAMKPNYAQMCFVGLADGHREIVRVDRSGPNGTGRAVTDDELRPVGEASFFEKTTKLASDRLYVSPIELDQEDGAEAPRPVLRVATPVFSADGKPFGVVMIEIDMRRALDRVRASGRPGEAVYVVAANGDYLVNPDRSREFGSRRGVAANWRSDMPYLPAPTGASQSLAQTVADQAGRPSTVAMTSTLLVGSEWIAVIETASNAAFMTPAAAIRNSSILVGLIAVLCAGVLAILIARSLTRPIVRLTAAVEGIAQKGTGVIPLDGGGETGVLARAFARVMDETNAKTVALEREVVEHLRTDAARERHAARERLFSAAVESSNDVIITMSLSRTITGWNPAAERLFGYSSAAAVGRHISFIIPPELQAEAEDTISRLLAGEEIEQFESVCLRKDGTPVETLLSLSPIKSAPGAIIGITKTARDVTERNRTQQALRQQTEELRRVFETSQDLIVVLDGRGHVTQISPSCEAILGYRPEEIVGSSSAVFIHPEHIENAREEIRATRHGPHSTISDIRLLHKDGHSVWLSWLGVWSEPVKRFFFVGRDMTETRKAEEVLRESEQLARGIIETALDAFVRVDARGIVQGWNSRAEAMLGWPRNEAIGRNVFELLAIDPARGPLRGAMERFLTTGQDQVAQPRHEIQVKRRDGLVFTAELSVTALRTRDGLVFNGFIRDLTDKIAAEERLRQAEKMEAVGQLTGGIAHDFNNILTVITGTIEILADAVKDTPQLAAITGMIDEAASRGADLTQRLLAFARKQPLDPRETDINLLISDTNRLLQRALGEQVQIESVFEDASCPAIVDPNQLATALLNLALNARDAMPDGGRLIIETASVVLDEGYAELNGDIRPGRYAMIAVSDTGSGIPADIIDKVFDPFFTSKGPGKGTGLGLSMVYGFIRQSAGHIKIYSEEGLGTTIKMYLPPASGASLAAEPEPVPVRQGGHETILVVEDDKLVRDYVLTQLHSLGYVTLDAANAGEALKIARAGHAFDLLLTDVIMPGLDGRQLADEIARIKPGVRVLFTSGYTENAIIHHGRLDEGVMLLAKPYRKADMAAMIRKALQTG